MHVGKSQQPLARIGLFLLVDLLGGILYFPIWWYSQGLVIFVQGLGRQIAQQYTRSGLGVWVSNIFTPMFGQYDWQGRLISFCVRLFQIVFRGLYMIGWMVIMLVLLLAWLFGPIYGVYHLVKVVPIIFV